MRRILFFGFIALMLIGGGIGGYFAWITFFPSQDQELAFDPVYPLDSIIFPVIKGDSVAKYVHIDLHLVVVNEAAVAVVDRVRPRLLDAYLIELMDYFSELNINAPVDAKEIKERLKFATTSFVGDGIVDNIKLDGVFERRQGR